MTSPPTAHPIPEIQPRSITHLADGHLPLGKISYLWSDNLSQDILKEDALDAPVPPIRLFTFRDVEMRSDYMAYVEGAYPITSPDLYQLYVKDYVDKGLIAKLGFPQVDQYRSVEEPVVIVSQFNMSTYGHFLLEVLPKILLARSLRRAGRSAKIVFPNDAPYVSQIVKSICEPDGIIMYESRREILRVPLAVAPTRMWGRGYYLHQVFASLLRTFALETSMDPTKNLRRGRRLFLSRAKQVRSFRRLTNEAELFTVAKSFGFQLVHPQDLPWKDQVRLFNGATHIIGEYTSALHNHLFSPAGTKIIAFGRLNSAVCGVAASLGQQVGFLFPTNDLPIKFDLEWTKSQLFEIDPNELQRRLSKIMA